MVSDRITEGKYKTRDGRPVEIVAAGALVASGKLNGDMHTWRVSDGRWMATGREHRWDLVERS